MRHQEVIDILNEVIRIVESAETDVVWSGYDSAAVVLADLTEHVERVTRKDFSRRREIKLLFAPTGPLQEISLSSGWGAQFLGIVKRFDSAIKDW